MITVLYHSNCYDGFGSAWAAWKRFGDRAKYIPVSYGQPLPNLTDCNILYILDFSYPPGILADLHENIRHITLLDHHKTAEADLVGVGDLVDTRHLDDPPPGIFVEFKMKESGATLAWDYFHDNGGHLAEKRPLMINYLKDRDLWLFDLQGSREINAAVRSYPFDFATWDREIVAQDAHLRLVHEGAVILKHQDQMVAVMCGQVVMVEMGGYCVPCVNATVYFSEVGESLCQQFPDVQFSAYYLDRADGKRQWGLRSRGDFDVSVVAKKYGGGGHKGAAGFITERPALI